ncbi:MAG: BA14K family protein [Roseiarcus sp.]
MRSLLKGTVVLALLVCAVPALAQPGDPGPLYTGLASTFFPPDFSEVYPDGYYRPVATGFPFPDDPPSAAPDRGGAIAYCEQHFHSYNPEMGTYLGYDGMRHPCP